MIDWPDVVAQKLREQNDPESHIETEPYVFHPSQLGYCDRQAYLAKLGLKEFDTVTLGRFKTGTIIHEWFEHSFGPTDIGDAMFEVEVRFDPDGSPVEIVGTTDCWHYDDPDEQWVYDFKSRAGWYNFDPPKQRHMDQLYLYMEAFDVQKGQVVYVSKKDMEIRPYPEDHGVERNDDRVVELVEKAERVGQPVEENGLPEGPQDVPFDPCGCWICDNETLDPTAFF